MANYDRSCILFVLHSSSLCLPLIWGRVLVALVNSTSLKPPDLKGKLWFQLWLLIYLVDHILSTSAYLHSHGTLWCTKHSQNVSGIAAKKVVKS